MPDVLLLGYLGNSFRTVFRLVFEWHRQLLDQMSQEVPGVRPRVLRPETRTALEPYRSFRHLARHLYGFDLKWPEMQPLLLNATSVIEALVFDLEQFCTFLEQLDVPET